MNGIVFKFNELEHHYLLEDTNIIRAQFVFIFNVYVGLLEKQ